ncbi:PREDICTED: interleukin-1 receptor-like 1 [Cyprinodon variegatus]|uniref:interleukin-1 receptor-like 1 n=1 Tax=Cyprinodon variegatus TaxID=28743 RepID=UPI000742B9D5|nr:PREDICTED: interleukin-1 receptor-like 1 [Cyprinodon variegatus]
MDVSRLLLSFILVIATPGAYSDSSCVHLNTESYKLLEGEAFYYVLDEVEPNLPDENMTWFKNGPEIQNITTDETQMIHYHGGALLFLNISVNDSGHYTAREITPGGCYLYHLKIAVYNGSSGENLNYGDNKISDLNKRVTCPDPVVKTCTAFNGTFTWFKGNNFLSGHHKNELRVDNATKKDEDTYTCVCTWKHNHKEYKSSGSRKLFVPDPIVNSNVEILSPSEPEQLVEIGASTVLNCTVFCGINAKRGCDANWHINGKPVNQMEGYNETKLLTEQPSGRTFFTAILTIEKVSKEDFTHEFKCRGLGYYGGAYKNVTLIKTETVTTLIIKIMCVSLIGVFTTALVKYFATDLVLLFRPYFTSTRHKKDTRMYDAYVVYQTESLDEETEETLSTFVTKILPSVLEDQCGYRLFIQGRDDIPGEDHVEMVESCIKQSKRLMIILTPGSGSKMRSHASNQTSAIGGLDWQVGLHHALVQSEMSVILIQLGETWPQDYAHLPLSLQHLIRKSAPLRWSESSKKASEGNSRFWKRVRYLMPATPAKKNYIPAVI